MRWRWAAACFWAWALLCHPKAAAHLPQELGMFMPMTSHDDTRSEGPTGDSLDSLAGAFNVFALTDLAIDLARREELLPEASENAEKAAAKEASVALFLLVLQAAQRSDVAWNNAGVVHLRKSDNGSAGEGDASAFSEQLEHLERATSSFRGALALNPFNRVARLNLGHAHALKEKKSAKLKNLSSKLKRLPSGWRTQGTKKLFNLSNYSHPPPSHTGQHPLGNASLDLGDHYCDFEVIDLDALDESDQGGRSGWAGRLHGQEGPSMSRPLLVRGLLKGWRAKAAWEREWEAFEETGAAEALTSTPASQTLSESEKSQRGKAKSGTTAAAEADAARWVLLQLARAESNGLNTYLNLDREPLPAWGPGSGARRGIFTAYSPDDVGNWRQGRRFEAKQEGKKEEKEHAFEGATKNEDLLAAHCYPDLPSRWLLASGTDTGSNWHIDPLNTSAWNALISGRKRWALLPPEVHWPVAGGGRKEEQEKKRDDEYFPSREEAMTLRLVQGWWGVTAPHRLETPTPLEYFSRLPSSSGLLWQQQQQQQHPQPLECMQRPGDVVFVPQGWWHTVLNLSPAVALTHNRCLPQDVCATFGELKKRVSVLDGRLAGRLKEGQAGQEERVEGQAVRHCFQGLLAMANAMGCDDDKRDEDRKVDSAAAAEADGGGRRGGVSIRSFAREGGMAGVKAVLLGLDQHGLRVVHKPRSVLLVGSTHYSQQPHAAASEHCKNSGRDDNRGSSGFSKELAQEFEFRGLALAEEIVVYSVPTELSAELASLFGVPLPTPPSSSSSSCASSCASTATPLCERDSSAAGGSPIIGLLQPAGNMLLAWRHLFPSPASSGAASSALPKLQLRPSPAEVVSWVAAAMLGNHSGEPNRVLKPIFGAQERSSLAFLRQLLTPVGLG